MRKLMLVAAIAIAMTAGYAVAARNTDGGDRKSVVCKTCRDTGKTSIKCDVCRGTKYVWVCNKGNKKDFHGYKNYDYDDYNGDREEPSEYCGYGSTYTALHKQCKNTRKRIVCPNCCNKAKTSASGYVEVECPDCDGEGNLVKTYYIIRDIDRIYEYDARNAVRYMKTGKGNMPNNYLVKKMSDEDVEDYKAVYPRCEMFTDIDDFKKFVEGDREVGDAKIYYMIRNADEITISDKRVAIEELGSEESYGYSGSNILKKRVTEEFLADFRALNPKCEIFDDYKEFKKFIRNAKTYERYKSSSEGSRMTNVRRKPAAETGTRRTRRRVDEAEPEREAENSVSLFVFESDADDEVDEKEQEEADEKDADEVYKRKFGKERRKSVSYK